MRVGVVGCGAISDIYLTNMIHNFENLEVAACCAGHLEHAKKKAEQYGIKAVPTRKFWQTRRLNGSHSDTGTDPRGLIRQALEAGKHVYTEKTMTLAPETAAKLIELAEEKHLYLGSAPDTFLGSALQTARKAIDDGLIGEVTSFEACANRDLDLLASIFRFLRMPGGGICYDFGVYYLTAIVSLFGPVDRVVSSVRNLAAKRVNIIPGSPEYGQEFDYTNESQVFTILEMKNGVTGTFCVNGDSVINDQAVFTIYGKKGILKLVDPNNFGGDVVYIPGVKDWTQQAVPEVLHYGFDYSENSRGLGPSEMAEAIAEGRPNRASAKMAYHVLDTIDQIMKSAETGAFEKVPSICERPEAMPNS